MTIIATVKMNKKRKALQKAEFNVLFVFLVRIFLSIFVYLVPLLS